MKKTQGESKEPNTNPISLKTFTIIQVPIIKYTRKNRQDLEISSLSKDSHSAIVGGKIGFLVFNLLPIHLPRFVYEELAF